jgi:disulfide bond formation protein DsbB
MRSAVVTSPAYRLGAYGLVGALTTLLVAFGFEYIGGYIPCPLCLQQRWAYYFGILATFFGLILLGGTRPNQATWVFFIVALAYFANAGLGVYHAGAEWKFWPGPDTCGAGQTISTSAGGLLRDLGQTRVIRCDEAPWRFLGLSFAGWNVVVSFLLWITLLQAAFAAAAVPKGKFSQ